jgi:ribosomal-protein-alanine N-acetyltransferase
MRRDDLEEVAVLEALCFPLPWTVEMFQQELDKPEMSTILVARLESAAAPSLIAGYICTWVVEDELQINNLAVHPRCRRQGIADALLLAALDVGRGRGARRAILEVRVSNAGAQALYCRHDFEPVGVRRRYYTHPVEDAILMVLEGI